MVWPDGPERRDRDELGLHPPAGGVFRIVEAARERDPVGRRQLVEDLVLLLLRQVLRGSRRRRRNRGRARPRRRARWRQLLEDLLADRVVDLGQRGEVEIGPIRSTRRGRRSGSRASIRSPTSDSCRSASSALQRRGVAGLDDGRDTRSTKSSRSAPSSSRRSASCRLCGHVLLIEHAEPRRRGCESGQFLRAAPYMWQSTR